MVKSIGINLISIVKYVVVGLIFSLILGFICYCLTLFTVNETLGFTGTGLTVFGFVVGFAISAGVLSAHMKNHASSLLMSLIIAVLTGFLVYYVIYLFMGPFKAAWFDEYIGNQAFLLIFVGIIISYIGNVYLKDKIHFEVINKYLGE